LTARSEQNRQLREQFHGGALDAQSEQNRQLRGLPHGGALDEEQRAIRVGLSERASIMREEERRQVDARRAEGRRGVVEGRRQARERRQQARESRLQAEQQERLRVEQRTAMAALRGQARRLLEATETVRIARDWSTAEAWSEPGVFDRHERNLQNQHLTVGLRPVTPVPGADRWAQWKVFVDQFFLLDDDDVGWTWWYHTGVKAPTAGGRPGAY